MDVLELKSDLHRLIDSVNDKSTLNAIRIILTKQSKSVDWADDLSDDLRNELEMSIAEADKGQTISHQQAMKEIKQKYNF